MSSSIEPEQTNDALEKTQRNAIIIFILLAVFLGTSLIAAGVLIAKGTYYEVILATIGSTLIAVGVVDVVSETFIRPGTIDVMRRCFPLFVNPAKTPKDTLKQQLVTIVGYILPKPESAKDFAKFFKEVMVDQLTDLSRENFGVTLELEKVKLSSTLPELVKVTCEWKYQIHNYSNKERAWEIPFYCNTFSLVNKGLALKDHIMVEQVLVTHGAGQPEDVGIERGIYKQQPKQYDGKVELVPKESLLVKLLPNEVMSVYLKYHYIGELCDRHAQRMSMLTYNANLAIDFDQKDIAVTVDDFCSLKKTPVAKLHRLYDWNGWFLPNHGFIVEWKPA